jgi:hypothetical protein
LCVKVKSFLRVRDECPLTVVVPKPSLVLAKAGSAFDLRLQTSDSTTEVGTSGHRVFGESMQPVEVGLCSESDSEQAAQGEEHQNAIGMDLDPEEYGVDPSTNVNVSGKPFPYYSLSMLMSYPRTCD